MSDRKVTKIGVLTLRRFSRNAAIRAVVWFVQAYTMDWRFLA